MRVAVGGIMQETNTFCALPTTLQDFAPYILRGDAVVSAFEGTRTPVGGFLDAARTEGFTTLPIFFARAVSSGLTEAHVFEELTGELVGALEAVKPVDGVLLALHGAMAAEGIPDADGEIVRRVRDLVGSELPIAVEVDLHANISTRLVESVNVLVGYDTYPHVDTYERGVEAGTLLARTLRGEIRPVLEMASAPLLLVPQMQQTARPPMATLLREAHRLETEPGMLSVTVAGGFCYADVPHAGFSVVAMADGNRARADAAARRVAEMAWTVRDAFAVRNVSVADAVAEALAAPKGPVIMVDVGDNIGGGGPGDGTVLLQALMGAGATGAVVTIADADAVAAAAAAGVGRPVQTTVGGKTDVRHGFPVPVAGRVRSIGDGRYVNKGFYMTGALVETGLCAVIEVDGIEVLLTERRTPPFDLEQLRTMGIEPTQRRIIVTKAAVAWRAAYESIATTIIEVDTPGVTSADLSRFTFHRVRRPIYPLDPSAQYPPAESWPA
ncbi:MAG: M81 family metallopeptidase [Armatimonadota bacterium]|nr:M81 family metallopeptidase [Armatimonadota bacterium]